MLFERLLEDVIAVLDRQVIVSALIMLVKIRLSSAETLLLVNDHGRIIAAVCLIFTTVWYFVEWVAQGLLLGLDQLIIIVNVRHLPMHFMVVVHFGFVTDAEWLGWLLWRRKSACFSLFG